MSGFKAAGARTRISFQVVNLVYPNDDVSLGSGFAFTFTHVRVGDFVGAPPLLCGGQFKEELKAEDSFSGEGGN